MIRRNVIIAYRCGGGLPGSRETSPAAHRWTCYWSSPPWPTGSCCSGSLKVIKPAALQAMLDVKLQLLAALHFQYEWYGR